MLLKELLKELTMVGGSVSWGDRAKYGLIVDIDIAISVRLSG